ncbi:extracellular solute-binding protein [Sulfobacillus sp. hq2]|uniref:extracellular solute-binding protein n=1 Tax=Sulfobacillus sp. hq2 TaxID=2039167 RepID=UPI001FA85DBD|nr:extracellular solute-binding protein [Sulfobacillus sp. hq2]
MAALPSLSRLLAGLALAGVLAGCGTSSVAPSQTPVHVAYAGSLQLLNNNILGPTFHKLTGIPFQGQGGGSFGIAHEIAQGSIPANVFESIGDGPIQLLTPQKTTWALAIAASPLVIAYNPHSPFAATFRQIQDGQKPFSDVFALLAQPGFKLGRTNPNTDPQGQAFVMMIELAQKQYHLNPQIVHNILGPIDSGSEIYTEEGVLSLLQSGGLDASSAFLSEAVERHLDYIALPPSLNFADPQDAATYASAQVKLTNGKVITGAPLTVDVTTIGRPPSTQAVRFITFLLSKRGQAAWTKNGYTVFPPQVVGHVSEIPSPIRKMLPHA